jgi:hypothetical protein
VIPAESSSVAAAIRSSIFCCWLLKILDGAGLRRRVGGDVGFEADCDPKRRCAALPAPSSEVFISDFGPLAASVLEAAAPAGS